MTVLVRHRLLQMWAWLWTVLLGALFAGVTALTLAVWATDPTAAVTSPVTDLAFAALGGAIVAGIASQVTRDRPALGIVQAFAGSVLLAAAGALGARVEPLTGGLVFVAVVGLLWALRTKATGSPGRQRPDLALGAAGLVGLLLAAPIATRSLGLALSSGPSCFLGGCARGDRLAEFAAAVTLFPLLAVLTAIRAAGWPIPLWTAAAGALVVGSASLAFPNDPASLQGLGGGLAIAWAAGLVALGHLRQHHAQSGKGPA